MIVNKLILQDFIRKYNLGKTFESTKWAFKDGHLITKITSNSKTLIGEVKVLDFYDKTKYDYGEKGNIIGIYNTEKFSKVISALAKEFDLNFGVKVGERFSNINFKDSKFNFTLNLADLNFLPKTSSVAKANYTIKNVLMNKEFMDSFLTACNTLEYKKFILKIVEKELKTYYLNIKIVESQGITNSVSLDIPILLKSEDDSLIKELGEMNFSGPFLKEIFNVNKNAIEGILNIDEDGMLNVNFTTEIENKQILSKYYLIKDDDNEGN